MSTIKSSAFPSMVEPFLPIVKLFTFQSAPSAIFIKSPVEGAAGSVIVNEPPEVSAIKKSFAAAVYVVVFNE
jgi:hypothetical protein